jgi:hypothetical protein
MEDSNLGFKWALYKGKADTGCKSMSLAIVGNTSLPTGSKFFREKALQPGITGIAQWSLTPVDQFGINLSYALLRDNGDQFGQTTVDASFSHQINPKVGSYLEAYTTLASDQHGGNRYFADLGFTYLANNNIMFDIFAGSNIDSDARLRFFGAGVSFRF